MDALAPTVGHHATSASGITLFRAETAVTSIPKFQSAGILFVVEGSKRLSCDVNVHIADQDHFLLTSAPVAFHIDTEAAVEAPLLAVHVAFDAETAMDIAVELRAQGAWFAGRSSAICQTSGQMDSDLRDLLQRILTLLHDRVACRMLMPGLVRELHFRLLREESGLAILAGLRGEGTRGKVLKTAAELVKQTDISIKEIAALARVSLSSYHGHFRALFGCTPLEYQKWARLHAARKMLKSPRPGIAAAAHAVGYNAVSQFSREFRRHFGRTARDEQKLMKASASDLDLV